MQEIWGWEDSLEEELATHSSVLAWKILRSLVGYIHGSQESDTTERPNKTPLYLNTKLSTFHMRHLKEEMSPFYLCGEHRRNVARAQLFESPGVLSLEMDAALCKCDGNAPLRPPGFPISAALQRQWGRIFRPASERGCSINATASPTSMSKGSQSFQSPAPTLPLLPPILL